MGKLSRRLFSKAQPGVPAGMAIGGVPDGETIDQGASRRLFLQSTAGAVSGAAMILAAPKVASIAMDAASPGASADTKAVVTEPSGPAPLEPVAAYVRNPERGEVTVMSGMRETTFNDPVLVKRLLEAAR
jgi:hypothetical protein